jgi:transposase
LIETAKIHGIDPHAFLADILAKLVNGWPAHNLDELPPWAWAEQYRVRLAARGAARPKAVGQTVCSQHR